MLDAKEQVSSAIQEINTAYKNVDTSTIKDLNNIRNKLNTSIKTTTSIVPEDVNKNSHISKDDIQLGMQVLVTNLNQNRYNNFISK